ncbi:helix-turn-helix domain-containing protein [Vibrio chagasii]|uniref:helix-turn-helix domain-containing protein n=1 Tax=Vibrio chagasii TaxID=170679 RepID=UPI00373568DE
MFGEYLKELRLSLGVTQRELAIQLNLADEEFQSLDVVTLSRWERGITKPTLSKCLRVLRCLKTDLSDFYTLIPNPNETKIFDEFAQIRFDNRLIKLSVLNYKAPEKTQVSTITELALLQQDNDEMLSILKTFFEASEYIPKGLFDVNLYDYQLQQRVVAKRFITKTGQLTGHSLSFIFEDKYFQKVINSKKFDIDLKKSVNYDNKNKLAICNYNHHTSNFEVFRCVFVSQYINLIRHSNIQTYYFFNTLPESEQILERLGFDKIAFDIESEAGGFKLGSRSFEHCLYAIDSAKLLSHPDIITLIKTTKWNNQHSNKSN